MLDRELNGVSEAELVTPRRRLGFIFQAHNLHESVAATQYVIMGLQVHRGVSEADAQRAAPHALGLVGLSERVGYLPGNLSGGPKQRVAVARALVGNPALLLAEEPTAALEKESAAEVVDLLKEIRAARDMTTRLVTLDNRILDRADRILTLENGRIVTVEDRGER